MMRSWLLDAACKGMSQDIWFPNYPSGVSTATVAARVKAIDDAAKAVCAVCPVFDECARWADEYPEVFGTWAGRTAPERAKAQHRHYRGAA